MLNMGGMDIVTWGERYTTGIAQIDSQHMELVSLTNKLFHACLDGKQNVDSVFEEAMHRLVEYVRYHFSEEQTLLERINFPKYRDHKKEHDSLVRDILEMAREYSSGKKYVPNHLVRALKDWVFGHIAVSDQDFSNFVRDQKKKGLLCDL